MANKEVIRILTENGLKVTPQRTAVLEVVMNLHNHPTADYIAQYLRLNYPHIPIGTVYKILEIFVEKGIIKRVKTDNDILRYDAIKEKHHHLYCDTSQRIEDYYDDELYKIISEYFSRKKIPDFTIEDFKLQIVGKFNDKNKEKKPI
jgi:Fur family peroxide stress response transcriptional regulator